MAQQTINIGAAPNDGTGDTLRDAFDKCNDNFTELYGGSMVPTAITVANEASDTTCFPLFATGATGDLGPKTNAGLAFNSSTGMLTATGFTGPLTGTADAANGLKSATTTVAVSAATAPTSGQVLTATSDSAATWQTPSASSPGGSSGDIQYNNGGSFAGSILSQGTNTISQLNSTNAQTSYLYGTYTNGSNYFRGKLAAADGSLTIACETAGTGADNGDVRLTPCGSGYIHIGGIGIQDDGNGKMSIFKGAALAWSKLKMGGIIDPTGDVALTANGVTGIWSVLNESYTGYRDIQLRNLVAQSGYHEMTEMTAPSAPSTNNVRIYAEDNGSGKTRLMALFPTGAAQQIAIEP